MIDRPRHTVVLTLIIASLLVACENQNQGLESRNGAGSGEPAMQTSGFDSFSFTRIAADGSPVSENDDEWACTRDNTTGLLWEVKSLDPENLHYYNHWYSWYQPDETRNGGDAGFDDIGPRNCKLDRCNTHEYVQAINAMGLCGRTNWRLPGRREHRRIVNFENEYSVPGHGPSSSLRVDPDYFLKDHERGRVGTENEFWTADPALVDSELESGSAFTVSEMGGWSLVNLKFRGHQVRLVSGPNEDKTADTEREAVARSSEQSCLPGLPPTTPTERFLIHDDGTLTDERTGLMWMRCAIGQHWTGDGCAGKPTTLPRYDDALEAARATRFAGHEDWRIPDTHALESIAELRCHRPVLNLALFPNANADSILWSSTERELFGRRKLDTLWLADGYASPLPRDTTHRQEEALMQLRLVRHPD